MEPFNNLNEQNDNNLNKLDAIEESINRTLLFNDNEQTCYNFTSHLFKGVLLVILSIIICIIVIILILKI